MHAQPLLGLSYSRRVFICSILSKWIKSNGGLTFGFFPKLLKIKVRNCQAVGGQSFSLWSTTHILLLSWMTTRNNKWGNHSKLCASDILFITSIIWNQITKVIKMTQCTDKYIYKYIYRWQDKKENWLAVICHFLTCVWSDCLCACPQSTTETLRSNPWRQKDVGVAGKCRVPAKIAQQHWHNSNKAALLHCPAQSLKTQSYIDLHNNPPFTT